MNNCIEENSVGSYTHISWTNDKFSKKLSWKEASIPDWRTDLPFTPLVPVLPCPMTFEMFLMCPENLLTVMQKWHFFQITKPMAPLIYISLPSCQGWPFFSCHTQFTSHPFTSIYSLWWVTGVELWWLQFLFSVDTCYIRHNYDPFWSLSDA